MRTFFNFIPRPGWKFSIFSVILLILTAAYQYVTRPSFVEEKTRAVIENNTGVSAAYHVVSSSLFFGFDIRDIDIKDRKTGIPIIKAGRLRLSLFLPSILIGHIGIRDLALEKPEIYLINTDGVWNYEALTGKPSPPPEKKPSSPLPPSINTYLPLKLYANVHIDDLAFHYQVQTGERKTSLDVSNVSARLAMITDTFREIPLNLGLLNLFDTLIFALNPDGPVRISFTDNNSIQGEMKLSWFLYRDTGRGETEFVSRMRFDSAKLFASSAGELPLPFGLGFYYDTAYDAPADRLLIRSIRLSHDQDPWIDLKARVDHASEETRELSLDILESRIYLDSLSPLLQIFLGPYARISGTAALAPLSIRGRLDRVFLKGNIQGQNLFFSNGGVSHDLRDFRINIDASMNLYEVLPFLEKPEGYKSDTKLAFGMFYSLSLPELRCVYNGASLVANAVIEPEKGIDGTLHLVNLPIDVFTAPALTGSVYADLSFHSNEQFNYLDFAGTAGIAGARYAIGRSRSGVNNLDLNANGRLTFGSPFGVEIGGLNLSLRNAAGEEAASILASGRMAFGGGQSYDIQIKELRIDYARLHPMLTGNLQYSLFPYRTYLSEGISLNVNINYRSAGNTSALVADAKLSIPYLHINDLRIKTNSEFSPDEIKVNQFEISALGGALYGSAQGRLFRPAPDSGLKPEMTLVMGLAQEQLIKVHENIAIQGIFNLEVALTPSEARGRITMSSINLEYTRGSCENRNSSACLVWRIEGLNFDLPFRHNLEMTQPERLSGRPAGSYITAYTSAYRPNLSIRFIASNFSPRGEYMPNAFFYTGALTDDKGPGLSAAIEYRNNVLFINRIKAQAYTRKTTVARKTESLEWIKKGDVDGKDIFFNLADLNTEHMEFGANLQIKDLDLEPYMPRNQSDFDGIISADLSVSTSSLLDTIGSTTMRLAVHQISPQFSGFAARILMPELIASAVQSTLKISSMLVELRGGLVYTSISTGRGSGIYSLFIKPSAEDIKEERIPLAQFLTRARNEARGVSEGEGR